MKVPRGAKIENKVKVLPNLADYGARPKRPIILYDIESSGECRAVREAATGMWMDNLQRSILHLNFDPSRHLFDSSGYYIGDKTLSRTKGLL